MWGAVFWPGGSPCWTGDCAPRRSLQPCCPAKHGGEMRGASAPPMSPPLLPRLLCIQIHPPYTNQTPQNDGSQQSRGLLWDEQWILVQLCPNCQFVWAVSSADRSVGTLESAPTCAPLMTAFLCAIWIYKSRSGCCEDSKNVFMSFPLSLGINLGDVELHHRLMTVFLCLSEPWNVRRHLRTEMHCR